MTRYLVDTNVWMQLLRSREHADVVRRFLASIPPERLAISIYSLHGVGVVLGRHGQIDAYRAFVDNAILRPGIEVVAVPLDQLVLVSDLCLTHKLDYDDAYQYLAAQLHSLRLISLDADFDRTPLGRLTPDAALAAHQAAHPAPPTST